MPDTPVQPVKRESVQVTYAPARRTFRRRLGSAARYWARTTFSRESFVSSLKSLLWVAPLTGLIWIYAEREQVVTMSNVAVTLEARSNESSRVVRLRSPFGGTVHVEIKGPQAELDQVKDWLESAPIPIEVGHNLSEGDHQIFVAAELNRLPQVVSKGVTVTSCLPEDVRVWIDPIVDRELDVKVRPDDAKVLDGAQVFSPSKVKISGPRSVIEPAMKQHPVAYVDLGPFQQQLAEPGKHALSTVAVTPSLKLDDPNITLSPPIVSAEIVVADRAEKTYVMPYLRVLAAYPSVSDTKFDQLKAVYDSTLLKVTVSGPEQWPIALLQEQKYIPAPAAIFEVNYGDVDNPAPAPLIFQLPPGVHVSEQDAQRTITYSFKPRNRNNQAFDRIRHYNSAMTDWKSYAQGLGEAARSTASQLATLSGSAKVAVLHHIAAGLGRQKDTLLAANARDISAAQQADLPAALIERLKLSEKKIAAMADSVGQIAAQVDPVGQIIEGYVRPNGLRIQKVRVPLGVVLFFYESRPNVTSDAAALCLKSGNAVILRGGKEAFHSNQAIVSIVKDSLQRAGLDANAVQFVESTDRAVVTEILKLDRYIDLVIPRGGESLIRAVVKDSTIPVLKHFTGNCHIYVDAATMDMEREVREVCVNAKTSYPGGAVCNAVEKILFHKDAVPRLLPGVCQALADQGVEIRADDRARALYPPAKPATESDWPTEYLAFTIAIKVVDSMTEAIDHINRYGSRHTDAILTRDIRAADEFSKRVDSASIMINASTRFADGGEYGLGAEIGISTDKLHARGPMGAADLTTYKWIVTGEGHVRG